jgi:hypothetical protein
VKLVQGIRRTVKRLDRFLQLFDAPAGANRVEKRTAFEGCQRPVLLLYGFFATRRTFDVLERRLRRDGYGVFSLNLGGLRGNWNVRGIDDLAALVRAKVERIYARYPGMGPLTIVGHSKGGLIACYYVKKMGGWRRTRGVVTLGTPHHGTPYAWLGLPVGFVARSLVQMIPGSPFLRRLADGPWPAQVRLTSIWSRRDAATPYPHAVIDTHGLPHLANREVDALHQQLQTSKRAYEAILQEIEAAFREAPVVRGKLTGLAGGGALARSGERRRRAEPTGAVPRLAAARAADEDAA